MVFMFCLLRETRLLGCLPLNMCSVKKERISVALSLIVWEAIFVDSPRSSLAQLPPPVGNQDVP